MNDNTLENIIAFSIVAAIVVGVIFAVQQTGDEEDVQRFNIPVEDDPALGSPTAPVTIIEFSDFACVFCAEFAINTKETLMEFVDNGTVRFVFKDYPLDIHPRASQLAKAAGCAQEQGSFWQYHDLLYENMDRHEIVHLEEYAVTSAMNLTQFQTCFAGDSRYGEIERDLMQGRQYGVRGTPTFFFNGRRVTGALTPQELRAEIQTELTLQ